MAKTSQKAWFRVESNDDIATKTRATPEAPRPPRQEVDMVDRNGKCSWHPPGTMRESLDLEAGIWMFKDADGYVRITGPTCEDVTFAAQAAAEMGELTLDWSTIDFVPSDELDDFLAGWASDPAA